MRRFGLTAALLCLFASTFCGYCQEPMRALTAEEVREMAAAGTSFRGAVLSGMDLSALRATQVDLAGTNWARADLRGAVFTSVDLTRASLDEVSARGAMFTECVLVNATLRHGDLSGAAFTRVQLAGADFAGSRLAGAEFSDATYSRTGGMHSGAVAAALRSLSVGEAVTATPSVSPNISAGLSGGPFAFVYNTADPSQWPMAPFTESPIRAAALAAGHDVKAYYDLAPGKAVPTLLQALKAGSTCVLPISLKGEEMTGRDFDQAFWGAAVALNDMEKPVRIVVLVPPFGRREYTSAELIPRWEGPWPTLEAAGAERSQARCPLIVLSRGANPNSARDTILTALRHAVQIIREPRTYTTLIPGAAGLQRLATDLRFASQPTTDPELLNTLAVWGGRPRALLISARRAAADFLEDASAQMLQGDRPGMIRAAALYRGEAQILETSFPPLQSESIDEQREAYATASKVINEAISIETAVANVLEEIAGS